MPDGNSQAEAALTISDSAAKRISQLAAQEGNGAAMLRIVINSGGCSGFTYAFDLADTKADGDLVFEKNGVTVVVDEVSLDFIRGAELDFVEDLIGSFFSLRNPNATATCGCGTSFAV